MDSDEECSLDPEVEGRIRESTQKLEQLGSWPVSIQAPSSTATATATATSAAAPASRMDNLSRSPNHFQEGVRAEFQTGPVPPQILGFESLYRCYMYNIKHGSKVRPKPADPGDLAVKFVLCWKR